MEELAIKERLEEQLEDTYGILGSTPEDRAAVYPEELAYFQRRSFERLCRKTLQPYLVLGGTGICLSVAAYLLVSQNRAIPSLIIGCGGIVVSSVLPNLVEWVGKKTYLPGALDEQAQHWLKEQCRGLEDQLSRSQLRLERLREAPQDAGEVEVHLDGITVGDFPLEVQLI